MKASLAMLTTLIWALVLAPARAAQTGPLAFAAPRIVGLAGDHVALALGDFDGDGAVDVATADASARAVTVLSGDARGGFRSTASHPLRATPRAIAAGDLNGDGALDLVVATEDAGGVFVLAGATGGAFEAPAEVFSAADPRAVAVGDFNGDLHADIAVADRGAGTIALLPGDGSGAFGVPTFVAVGGDIVAIAVGDVNADGSLDLATADRTAGTLSILTGDGTGLFVLGPAIAADNPRAVAIADLNGDGLPDLAVAPGGGTAMAIMLGDGTGGFGPPVGIEIGGEPVAAAIADLNRDGKPDVAAALAPPPCDAPDPASCNRVSGVAIVLTVTGDGSLAPPDGGDSMASASALGAAAVQCDFTWIHQPGSRNWNDPNNWSPFGLPGATSTACVGGPEPGRPPDPVFITVPAAVGTLVIEPGAAIEVRTRFELVQGADLSGDIVLCGKPDGELALAPGAVVRMRGSRIETVNNPNIPCGDDTRVVVPAGATVRNESGNSVLTGRIDFAGRAEAASGRLTFRSNLSFPIASRWGAAVLSVDDDAAIELGGREIMGAGSRKVGPGLLDITGDQRGELTIDGPSRLAPSARMTGGSTVVSDAGSIDIVGFSAVIGHQLIVNGAATIDPRNGGFCVSAGAFEVGGTAEIRAPDGAIGNCASAGTGFVRVRSGGTLRKHADSTGRVQLLFGVILDNDGSIVVDGGHLWVQEGAGSDTGVYTLAGGTLFERVGGNWHLSGSVRGEGLVRLSGSQIVGSGQASVENLHLAFGGLSGHVRLTGTMTFDSGTIAGTLEVRPGATLNVPVNPQFKELANGSLGVFGTAVVDQEFCANGASRLFVQGGGLLHFRQAVIAPCGGPGTILVLPGGTLQSDNAGDRQILWFPTQVFGRVAVTSGTLRIFETNQWDVGSELAIAGGAVASIETFNSSDTQQFGANSRVTGAGVLDVNGRITGRPTFFSTVNLRDFALFEGAAQADAWGPINMFGGRLQNGYVLNVLEAGNLFTPSFFPCGGQLRVSRGALYLRASGPIAPCAAGQGSLRVMPNGTLVGAAAPGTLADLGVSLTNEGTVRVESGRLRFFGTNLVETTLTGGSWVVQANAELSPFASVSTNAASITLDGPGAVMRFDSFLGLRKNAAVGRVSVLNGATLTTRDFTNEGALTVGAGSTFDAQTFLQQGGVTSLAHVTAVVMSRSGTPSIEGGLLEGIGVVRPGVRNAGGTVRAGLGDMPGVLHVDGNYVETADGTLKTFLRSATEYSVLNVMGHATFAGTLHVDPWTAIDSFGDVTPRFIPAAGDTFRVVTYGDHSDTHSQVGNVYFTEFGHFFRRHYQPADLTITVEPRMIVGDVAIDASEGDTDTYVVARFTDNEFGRTGPAEFTPFVFWSNLEDGSEATLRFDDALGQFVVETTRAFLESGPVDLFVSVGSNGPDGQGFGSFLTVDVRNLPPTVTPSPNRSVVPGEEVRFDVASFADPGVLDTHVADINWGDGTITPGDVTGMNGAGTVAGGHVYAAAGRYTVVVVVTDDEGASASASFEVEAGISLESLSPASGPKGGVAFALQVSGRGFTPGTRLLWNGAERPTTVLSGVMLEAEISASDLAISDEIGVALVTARLPGGAQSNALAFTIVGSAVDGSDSAVAANGGTAGVAAPGVAAMLETAEGSGPVSVTAARYADNPTGVNALNAGGSFYDLLVGGNAAAARLTAALYYPRTVVGEAESDLQLLYFGGAAWLPVRGSGGTAPAKDTTDNLDGTMSGGRFAVTFDATSTPPITALTGTVFALGTVDTTAPTCTAVASPGALWPPNGKFVAVRLAVDVADGGSGAAGFTLVSLTSSEGPASQDSRGFAIGTPDRDGELRAKRLGTGAGRVYTFTYEAIDHAGNTARCAATVTVPHDQGSR